MQVFYASASSSENEAGNADVATTLLLLSAIYVFVKFSSLLERVKIPSVLGELIVGIIIGNLIFFFGDATPSFLQSLSQLSSNHNFIFLAELGVVILMLQVGLESDLKQMKQTFSYSLSVALIGVIAPMALAYWLVPFLLPNLASETYLFIGATLTATSVGISARIFRDANMLNTQAGQIVLGAAVADDVIGLLILAAVSGIVISGAINATEIAIITVKAISFFVLAFLLGGHIKLPATPKYQNINQKIDDYNLASLLSKLLATLGQDKGSKLLFVVILAFIGAFIAKLIGLEPIIGAFAIGLILEHVHFKSFKQAQDTHIEELVAPLGYLLVPLFFVYVGMQVNLSAFMDANLVMLALVITVLAILGKWVAGLVAPKGIKNIVGFGMVPRGEVGLIFALVGKSLGVINEDIFSLLVMVVVLSTLITPPILQRLLTNK